ncbi:MAG: polysaccharide deacetylase family protein [Gemmatimonadota bacterium]|nr:polysaccharide deacetylase family protein [Gemmatimonadota bacterium]
MPRRKRIVRTLWIAGALLFVSQLVYWTEPAAAFAVAERLAPNVVWRVATDKPFVALSFDDGPDAKYTPQVLAILKRHGAHATFFLIGDRASLHPELVQRIKAEGHEVGNHYVMDASTLCHGDSTFLGHLDRTELAIGIPGPKKLFRPPGGIARPGQIRLAMQRGYTTVLGNAYPHDPLRPPVGYIRWLVDKNLGPGAIVILHDGIRDPTRSIEALPHILAAGKRKGLQFVSIGTLMQLSDDTGLSEERPGDPQGFHFPLATSGTNESRPRGGKSRVLPFAALM